MKEKKQTDNLTNIIIKIFKHNRIRFRVIKKTPILQLREQIKHYFYFSENLRYLLHLSSEYLIIFMTWYHILYHLCFLLLFCLGLRFGNQ